MAQQLMPAEQGRLSGHDLANVLPDLRGWPQTIGAVALLVGPGLHNADGELRGELVDLIMQRLRAIPALGRVIQWSKQGLGRAAYWAASSDDLVSQVKITKIPWPGDERSLINFCADLTQSGLQLDQALWEVWILDGLAGGRVALVLRLHHAIADGMGAMTTLASLFDNARVPTERATTMGNRGRPDKWRGWHRVWSQLDRLFGDGLAPRTSINRPIGSGRRLAFIRQDLAAMKKAGHQHSATVNDVLMSSITAGLRAVLASRGETTHGASLRAMVPIAGAAQPGRLLNATAGMLVRLPVGEADPERRLRLVATDTTMRKARPVQFAQSGIFNSSMALRLAIRLSAHQRISNLYAANIPGPSMPLTLSEAPVQELFPLVSLMGNTTLGVAGLSYAGQFNITVIV